MAEYNTSEIRRAARAIKQAEDMLSGDAASHIRKASSRVSSGFEGKAADAMRQSLRTADSDVRQLASGIHSLYTTLNRYADALEAADERLKQIMG